MPAAINRPAAPARWRWLAGLGLVVGCMGRDAGGQEGEEYDPQNDVMAGEGSDTAEDGGGGDGGDGDDGASDGGYVDWLGWLLHERGGSYSAGSRECELMWETEGERVDGASCPDCIFVFEVTETLDRAASSGIDACDDEAVDITRNLGFSPDYMGYGPALVAVDEGYWGTYMLGFAQLDDDLLHWSYGYEDYPFSYDGRTYYSTWLWEGEAELSD